MPSILGVECLNCTQLAPRSRLGGKLSGLANPTWPGRPVFSRATLEALESGRSGELGFSLVRPLSQLIELATALYGPRGHPAGSFEVRACFVQESEMLVRDAQPKLRRIVGRCGGDHKFKTFAGL